MARKKRGRRREVEEMEKRSDTERKKIEESGREDSKEIKKGSYMRRKDRWKEEEKGQRECR